jgi:hypothetical protein
MALVTAYDYIHAAGGSQRDVFVIFGSRHSWTVSVGSIRSAANTPTSKMRWRRSTATKRSNLNLARDRLEMPDLIPKHGADARTV